MWDYDRRRPDVAGPRTDCWPRRKQSNTRPRAESARDARPQSRRRGAARPVGRPRFPAQRLRPQPASSKDTQFADYHGHGWNFRGVFKRDREGNLLDADGKIVAPDDPEKWRKAGEGKFVAARHQPRQDRPPDGHPRREGHAMRRLPFRAGQPRQRLDLWRGRQRGRDRLQGLPRHRRRLSDPAAPRARPRRPRATTSRCSATRTASAASNGSRTTTAAAC